MCPPKSNIKNIAPLPNQAPEAAPTPIEITKDPMRKRMGGRKDLRIDLATAPAAASGVNV